MHPSLLNGKPRATLIESFNGDVFIIRPGFRKEFGKNLHGAQAFSDEQGWEISIYIIKGSPILHNIQKEG